MKYIILFTLFLYTSCQTKPENKKASKPLVWDEKTTTQYIDVCRDAAKINKGMDVDRFCKCLVETLKSNNIPPSSTDSVLVSHKDNFALCAKEAMINTKP